MDSILELQDLVAEDEAAFDGEAAGSTVSLLLCDSSLSVVCD
ncbi:SapB/AmfS family lanthipeptide [Actinoplanes sp. NPDC051494]